MKSSQSTRLHGKSRRRTLSVDSERRPRASASGLAAFRDGSTTLQATLDLTSLPSGAYQLAVRRLTNQEFHNTGVPAVAALPTDRGRMAGTAGVRADEFNCRSRWSDAPNECKELEFMVVASHELERAFKVPSLRNVAHRAPYMHAGQMPTLAGVLAHYNRAPAAPSGHTEIKPLKLNPRELRQLEAFLRTLSGSTTGTTSIAFS